MIYLQLFGSFFLIGLFSIGGGYAAMPLIQEQVVELHHWLTMTEFADIITIAEMTPGPISINSATFVGTRVAGALGAVVSTLGCITPSCIIVMTLAHFYFKYRELSMVQGVLQGLRPTVVALIASAGVSILLLSFFGTNQPPVQLNNFNLVSVGIFATCLIILRKYRLNPVFTMVGAGIAGIVVYQLIPYLVR